MTLIDRKMLFRAAGIAAILVLAIFPLQLSVFALAWPPPETAQAYFDLLHSNPVVGLLSLDVLLMVDWLILLVVWAGLYKALRPHAPRMVRVAMILVVAATVMYFISNTAFQMLSLSQQYASPATQAQRDVLLAAGASALATFDGPWFTVSYIMSGIAVALVSMVMWRAPAFGKLVGGIGIAYGALQIVPPNFGTIGMIVSLVSLVPMLAWLALVAWKLLRLARADAAHPRRRANATT
jgi:hypothetical protein